MGEKWRTDTPPAYQRLLMYVEFDRFTLKVRPIPDACRAFCTSKVTKTPF